MPALRLILLRHAKSAWDDPTLADHDRSLNDRGKRSCMAIGAWLADQEYLPNQVLCSTARRTRETWERIASHLPVAEVLYEPALYHAEPGTMLDHLRQATGACVMMIGHNPGMADFAGQMSMVAPAHPRFDQFPTAATLVLDFDAENWGEVSSAQGRVADFIVPRDLPGV